MKPWCTPLVVAEAKEAEEYAARYNYLSVSRPINYAEIRNAWMEAARKGRFNNPAFIYDINILAGAQNAFNRLTVARQRLARAIPYGSLIGTMLADAMDRAYNVQEFARCIAERNDAGSTRVLLRQFGALESDTLILANACHEGDYHIEACLPKVAKDPMETTALRRHYFTPHEVADAFRRIIAYYGLESTWSVSVDNNYASVTTCLYSDDIDSPKSVIHIPAGMPNITALRLASLLAHEFESHGLNSMNCMAVMQDAIEAPFPVARFAIARRNQELYEGYAKLHEYSAVRSANVLPSPYYILAASMAERKCSFGEIAETIYQMRRNRGVEHEAALEFAWNVTYKVFRGCTNTKNPHGFSRNTEKSYFIGTIQAAKLGTDHPMSNFSLFTKPDIETIQKQYGESALKPVYPNREYTRKLFIPTILQ